MSALSLVQNQAQAHDRPRQAVAIQHAAHREAVNAGNEYPFSTGLFAER